jgi:hypothetical protein
MKIGNWELARPDIDFGWEPRTLAADLKSLPQTFHIGKKRNRKKLDVTEWGIHIPIRWRRAFFDYILFICDLLGELLLANFLKATVNPYTPECPSNI